MPAVATAAHVDAALPPPPLTSSIPEEFICPLTLSLMKDPVASRYGHSFDREAIMAWMDAEKNGRFVCPMTRQELYPSMLVTNTNLKKRIQSWLLEQSDEVKQELHDDSTEPETESSDAEEAKFIFGGIREEDLEGLSFHEVIAAVREAMGKYSDDVVVMAVRRLARAKLEEQRRQLLESQAAQKKQGKIFKMFRKSKC